MNEKIKKRVSASINSVVVKGVELESGIELRSFSSMVEILLSEALKKRVDERPGKKK